MTPEERLAGFAGIWDMRRVVIHRDGAVMRLRGTATWAPDGAGLLCDEAGRMRMPDGTVLAVARRTIWRADPENLAVAFADGRPFHRIGPGARPAAAHDCPPDDYRLRYDFRRWPAWSVRWRVAGPRKDYAAVTRYARVEGGIDA